MNSRQRRKARRAQRCTTVGCSGRGPLYTIDFGQGIRTMPICRLCACTFELGPVYRMRITLPPDPVAGVL